MHVVDSRTASSRLGWDCVTCTTSEAPVLYQPYGTIGQSIAKAPAPSRDPVGPVGIIIDHGVGRPTPKNWVMLQAPWLATPFSPFRVCGTASRLVLGNYCTTRHTHCSVQHPVHHCFECTLGTTREAQQAQHPLCILRTLRPSPYIHVCT